MILLSAACSASPSPAGWLLAAVPVSLSLRFSVKEERGDCGVVWSVEARARYAELCAASLQAQGGSRRHCGKVIWEKLRAFSLSLYLSIVGIVHVGPGKSVGGCLGGAIVEVRRRFQWGKVEFQGQFGERESLFFSFSYCSNCESFHPKVKKQS